MKGFNQDHNPIRIASNVKSFTFNLHPLAPRTVRLLTLAGDGPEPDTYALGVDICAALGFRTVRVQRKGLTWVERNSLGLGVGGSMAVLNRDEIFPLIQEAYSKNPDGVEVMEFAKWLNMAMLRYEDTPRCTGREQEEAQQPEQQEQAVVPYIEAEPKEESALPGVGGVFNHADFGSLRVIADEETGEPWFVAKDVMSALGGGTEQIRRLDEDEKGLRKVQTPGGMQQLSIVSEPGLYTLIIRSNKPNAEPFRRWVTHEVLPAIRKHGGYLTPKLTYDALTDPDVINNLAQALKADREKLAASRLEVSTLKENLALAEKEKAEVQEKANVVDTVFAKPESKGGGERITPMTSFVRCMEGLNTMAIKSDLTRLGYLYYNGVYRVYADYQGADKLFVERKHPVYVAPAILLTMKGAALLSKLYLNGGLTMKKGYEKAYQRQTESYDDCSW